jgi:hypothetical protein
MGRGRTANRHVAGVMAVVLWCALALGVVASPVRAETPVQCGDTTQQLTGCSQEAVGAVPRDALSGVNRSVYLATECDSSDRCNQEEDAALHEALWASDSALECLGTDDTPCGAVKDLLLEDLARIPQLTATELIGTAETADEAAQAVATACVNAASTPCHQAELFARFLAGELRRDAFGCVALTESCSGAPAVLDAAARTATRQSRRRDVTTRAASHPAHAKAHLRRA